MSAIIFVTLQSCELNAREMRRWGKNMTGYLDTFIVGKVIWIYNNLLLSIETLNESYHKIITGI